MQGDRSGETSPGGRDEEIIQKQTGTWVKNRSY